MNNRFEMIAGRADEISSIENVGYLDNLVFRKKDLFENIEKIKTYLRRFVDEISAALSSINQTLNVKIGNYTFKCGSFAPYYFGVTGPVYFDDAIKGSTVSHVELILLTAEAVPTIEKEFEVLFQEKFNKVNSALNELANRCES